MSTLAQLQACCAGGQVREQLDAAPYEWCRGLLWGRCWRLNGFCRCCDRGQHGRQRGRLSPSRRRCRRHHRDRPGLLSRRRSAAPRPLPRRRSGWGVPDGCRRRAGVFGRSGRRRRAALAVEGGRALRHIPAAFPPVHRLLHVLRRRAAALRLVG